MALYGRDATIAEILDSNAALLIVSGDSGVGKSAVLGQAAAQTANATRLRALPKSSGGLRSELLRGLADLVTAKVEDQGQARRFGTAVVAGTKTMAETQFRGLVGALGAELLGIVKHRINPTAGDALGQYVKEVSEALEDNVVEQLASAVPNAVSETICQLVAASLALFEDADEVVIYLDRGERLVQDDLALLIDVAEQLPPRCRLCLAFSTVTGDQRTRVRQLLADTGARSQELEVLPLDEAAVGDWLDDLGLSSVTAADILRATNGYPIYVQEYAAQLLAGKPAPELLSTAPIHVFDLCWDELSPPAKRAARSLCVLSDPLPEHDLARVVGTDLAGLHVLLEELARARMFTEPPIDGQLWFHDLRRRYLFERLTPAERRVAATAAYEIAAAHATTPKITSWATMLAELASASDGLNGTDERLLAICTASQGALALIGGLLEIRHPPEDGAALAGDAADLALGLAGGEFDLQAAITELTDAGMLAVASQNGLTALAPRLSGREQAIVIGRSTQILTRTVVPDLARTVFELSLRPALEPFDDGVYGSGDPLLTDIVNQIQYWTFRKPDEPISFRKAEAVVGRAKLGSHSVWFGARFAERSQRDEAATRLADQSAIKVFGESVDIGPTLICPPNVVPALRIFNTAYHAFTGGFNMMPQPMVPKPTCAPTLAEHSRIRAGVLNLARECSTAQERIALGLEDAFAVYWSEAPGSTIVALVRTAIAEARELPELGNHHGTTVSGRSLGLGSDVRVVQVRTSGPAMRLDHPALAPLQDIANKAATFNRAAAKQTVRYSEQAITTTLRTGYEQLRTGAKAFAELWPDEAKFEEGLAVYVHILNIPITPTVVAGAGCGIMTATAKSLSGEDEIHIRWEEDPGTTDGGFHRPTRHSAQAFSEAFGAELEGRRLQTSLSGDLAGLIGGFTGWDRSSLILTPPD